jgi:subtilisin family serine protease
MSRTTGPLVLLAALALAVPTGAAAGEDDGLPHALPPARGEVMVGGGAAAAGGAATARASARTPLPTRWMLIARPTPAAARVAQAFAAQPLRLRGTYVVATARARALAAALRRRGLLRGAEPDVALRRASADEADPFGYARGTIVAPTLTPPAAFAPIGLVDDVVDASVPDVAQAKVIAASPGKALDLSGDAEVAHGTEVASVAAGRQDGQGVIGVAPGAPLLSFGYKTMSCAEVSDGILALVDAGAKVINLSFEAAGDCHALRLATAAAFGEGAVVVAAAGNDGDTGNPIVYPAAYPHVLTVGSLDLGLAPAADSSSGRDLDLAAPGEAIPVALPPALDRDGTADGLTRNSGTSFAAPMVSGAAAWLIAARPNLTAGQYADLLRASAKDVVTPGWDRHTGYGLPDLAAALAAPVPAADRGEPDDGIDQVDGTAFAKPDPYVTKPVSASVAPVEDPADVHRVRVKAHASVLARVTATAPATALTAAAYSGAITTLSDARPLARGRALRLRNATNKPKTYYIVVRAPDGAPRRPAATRYTLTLRTG